MTIFALILAEGAKALVADTAQNLATQMVNYIFRTLATKADIEAAVQELKTFVDQRIDQLEDDLENAGLLAAQMHLSDYQKTMNPKFLDSATDAITASIALFQTRSHEDDNFDRTHIVQLTKLINTDIAIWACQVERDAKNKDALTARRNSYADWLEQTVTSIEEYQSETLNEVKIESIDETPPYDPPVRPPRIVETIASFTVTGLRYKGGVNVFSVSEINNMQKAMDHINISHKGQEDRILNEELQRGTEIVEPCTKYIQSLRELAIQ
jgi:hypothetical protein